MGWLSHPCGAFDDHPKLCDFLATLALKKLAFVSLSLENLKYLLTSVSLSLENLECIPPVSFLPQPRLRRAFKLIQRILSPTSAMPSCHSSRTRGYGGLSS
jgi:hypothetical protein